MMSFAQVSTAQWSDTILCRNVQFQVGIDLTLFHFNTPTKLNYSKIIQFWTWVVPLWWLARSGIGPCMGNPISPLKDLSHAACRPVLVSSTYSASPTDNVTIFCCWDAQDTALLAIRKTCPNVEWWSSLFLPQSESEYLINLASELPLYLILILSSFVPFRYQSMYFAYLRCSFVGLLLNYDGLIAANVISGLVPIVA